MMRAAMRYVQTFSVTSSTTVPTFGTEQKFSLNSLYDPDITGSGHQPYGYDQLAALYKLYRVEGVRISITAFASEWGSLVVGAQVACANDTAALAGSSIQTVDERPGTVILYPSYPSGGTLLAKITQNFRIAQIEGISARALADDTQNYTAAVTTNPVRMPYLLVAAANPDASVTTYSCRVLVELEYDAIFYERITQAAS